MLLRQTLPLSYRKVKEILAVPMCIIALLLFGVSSFHGFANANQAKQQAAFGEVVYQYFQEDFQQVLQLTEVGLTIHGFSDLSKENSDRLRLMQGAAQLNVGLYNQSQAIFTQLLSQTNSDYVQANTWFFMAKAGFENKHRYLSERAYTAIEQGRLQEYLGTQQWHELLYMTAYARMQEIAQNKGDDDWQPLFIQIPQASIFKSYLLANHATNLFNSAQYEEASTVFTDAKKSLLTHQNSQGIMQEVAGSAFATFTWAVTPWRWFDESVYAHQAQIERKQAQDEAEQNALFDTINSGLGQSLLQLGDLNNAMAVLQSVSASGLESQQALLTYGWASVSENRWQQALAAWQYVQNNSAGLFALQASYGIAYAFGQQDNLAQAFFSLVQTSTQIDSSLVALVEFTDTVQQPEFFNQYNNQWPQGLSDLKLGFFTPTLTFDAKYLLSIREQAKSILQDIKTKKIRLMQLEQMLIERAQSYENRKQSLSLSLAQQQITRAQENISALNTLLEQSVDFDSQLTLSRQMASHNTRVHIARVDKADSRLQRLQTDTTRKRPLKPSYKKRLHIVSGIVKWELMDVYLAQKWQHQALLKQAQQAVTRAKNQYQRLQLVSQQQDAFTPQKEALASLNKELAIQTQYTQTLYNEATTALTVQLTSLINEREVQLKRQGINTRLAMLRIQDLQQEGQ
jgi:hypothetical protein